MNYFSRAGLAVNRLGSICIVSMLCLMASLVVYAQDAPDVAATPAPQVETNSQPDAPSTHGEGVPEQGANEALPAVESTEKDAVSDVAESAYEVGKGTGQEKIGDVDDTPFEADESDEQKPSETETEADEPGDVGVRDDDDSWWIAWGFGADPTNDDPGATSNEGPEGDSAECVSSDDCESFNCQDGVCQEASCDDGVQNGEESDVDCGDACRRILKQEGNTTFFETIGCAQGRQCEEHRDCASKNCADGLCAPSCHDGIQNGEETDVDCGGNECNRNRRSCLESRGCEVNEDCRSFDCQDGVCQRKKFEWECTLDDYDPPLTIEQSSIYIPTDLKVIPGEQIVVPVMMTHTRKMVGALLEVRYDSSVLTLNNSGIKLGPAFRSKWEPPMAMTASNFNEAGKVIIGTAMVQPGESSSGAIYELTFDVSPDATEGQELVLDIARFQGNPRGSLNPGCNRKANCGCATVIPLEEKPRVGADLTDGRITVTYPEQPLVYIPREAQAITGRKIRVPVRLKHTFGEPLKSVLIEVHYDSEVLVPNTEGLLRGPAFWSTCPNITFEVEYGTGEQCGYTVATVLAPGKLEIVAQNPIAAPTGPGDLFYLEFWAPEGKPFSPSTDLDVVSVLVNDGTVPLTPEPTEGFDGADGRVYFVDYIEPADRNWWMGNQLQSTDELDNYYEKYMY
jgi:hypothetical protein